MNFARTAGQLRDAERLRSLSILIRTVEVDGAGVGVLQHGDGAHEGALAGAVWARRPNMFLPIERVRFLSAWTPLG